MSADLTVVEAGTLTTVQDRGRLGLAHLGVPRAGPLDAPAAALANRLVGNDPETALLEVTLGGLEVRLSAGRWVAVTGAPSALTVGDRAAGHERAEWVPAGATVRLATPATGVRSYLAVAGGIAVEAVLGSRSTDTLAGVGPPVVRAGAVLPLGPAGGAPSPHDTPRPPRPGRLRVSPGPRAEWYADAVAALCRTAYTVSAESNRIGLRLDGEPLARARGVGLPDELPSEGMVLGAVQVPPSGTPVVFLADHPPTGGYPVVAVVDEDDLWQCAQLRPGDPVAFTPTGPPRAPRAPRR